MNREREKEEKQPLQETMHQKLMPRHLMNQLVESMQQRYLKTK